jgi:chromosome segregation ATPase
MNHAEDFLSPKTKATRFFAHGPPARHSLEDDNSSKGGSVGLTMDALAAHNTFLGTEGGPAGGPVPLNRNNTVVAASGVRQQVTEAEGDQRAVYGQLLMVEARCGELSNRVAQLQADKREAQQALAEAREEANRRDTNSKARVRAADHRAAEAAMEAAALRVSSPGGYSGGGSSSRSSSGGGGYPSRRKESGEGSSDHDKWERKRLRDLEAQLVDAHHEAIRWRSEAESVAADLLHSEKHGEQQAKQAQQLARELGEAEARLEAAHAELDAAATMAANRVAEERRKAQAGYQSLNEAWSERLHELETSRAAAEARASDFEAQIRQCEDATRLAEQRMHEAEAAAAASQEEAERAGQAQLDAVEAAEASALAAESAAASRRAAEGVAQAAQAELQAEMERAAAVQHDATSSTASAEAHLEEAQKASEDLKAALAMSEDKLAKANEELEEAKNTASAALAAAASAEAAVSHQSSDQEALINKLRAEIESCKSDAHTSLTKAVSSLAAAEAKGVQLKRNLAQALAQAQEHEARADREAVRANAQTERCGQLEGALHKKEAALAASQLQGVQQTAKLTAKLRASALVRT